jgi:Calcineurin-like phosphoesterase
MALEFIGCGDLHLDGKLRKYLPDLNTRIMEEVDKVLQYAKRNGVKTIVFYGDICETPSMSKEATTLFLKLLMNNPEFLFIVDLGNHDIENAEHHSLQVFCEMCKFGMLPNTRIVEKPTTFFRSSGTPLRVLPWPSLDTREDCLNVIHEAVSGSVWDHGRLVDGAKKVKHLSVAGHLHTSQTCGVTHFSGTLYQTSFGEKPNKYFHHVKWEDAGSKPVIKRVKHYPGFSLVNLIVSSANDLNQISSDPSILYKVFVKDSAVLDSSTFDSFPNVVKKNSFKTKAELQVLLTEELRIDEEFELPSVLSVENNLKSWLEASNADPSVKKAAYIKFQDLFKR